MGLFEGLASVALSPIRTVFNGLDLEETGEHIDNSFKK